MSGCILHSSRRGKLKFPFSVPVSRLPELVGETKKDLSQAGIRNTIVGHVGDGNFHALLLFRDAAELEVVSQAVHRLVHRAIAMDGTCQFDDGFTSSNQRAVYSHSCFPGTGEHGVGVGKKEYLNDELGENTVELMRTIKRSIDPLNILNPGKVCLALSSARNITLIHTIAIS